MEQNKFSICGQLVDVWKQQIYPATIHIKAGRIAAIEALPNDKTVPNQYILPGFIDSHVHVESSMLVPSEFARLAVVHGTVGTISDPHEIANVCGMEGVEFMLANGKQVNFSFNFGAPSCVPATTFETAGAALNSTNVAALLQREDIKYLSEMMNFPGVLYGDAEVLKKIAAAKAAGKPVDGHAPGLMGTQAQQYIAAGISTDHECFTAEEALNKLNYGMKILIREGSAAKNFDALIDLMHNHFEQMMFCSDDKHPDSLVVGHINQLCARAVAKGIDVFKVLQSACVNPVQHYQLNIGLLRTGDPADCIVVENLTEFKVKQTYIKGILVAEDGQTLIQSVPVTPINQFHCLPVTEAALAMPITEYPLQDGKVPVIAALEGQLITDKLWVTPNVNNNYLLSDVANDVLKMVVVNRYHPAPIAKAFIKNFGLKKGAIASTVAHDSHNIVAVGTNDADLAKAINAVIEAKGGVSAVHENHQQILPLPVAGLMSANDGYTVASAYTAIDAMVKNELGSALAAPFMTLSFMALLVIPHLKLSDKGLFDGDCFNLWPLQL
ncbi:MAG: adenine deaminase [Sphingobacteriales bacterium]|uniref:adenine deaminase n=1 Tax=Hydrotalea flava TaxID=714549 RepID=UPI00082FAEA1|nr:adenine deaminase [Hydrotalea flava]RTL55818.1 MAG: adenine deaminase [Sphingobacteriales bacterium]